MKAEKLLAGFGFILVFSLFFAAGCGKVAKLEQKPVLTEQQVVTEAVPAGEKAKVAEKTEEPAVEIEKAPKYNIALKPVKGQTTKYKLVSESVQSVEWVGKSPAGEDAQGPNYTRVEMIFSQEVKDVNESGNILYQITINELKMRFKMGNRLLRDFDSKRGNESAGPLAKLVGQSYTVEKSVDGQVIKIDAEQIRSIFTDKQRDDVALKLIDDEAIESRHGIIGMPAKGKAELAVGDTWSRIQTFSFGIMGSKTYEKIYTLKEVTAAGKAVATMEAIPSAENAEEIYQKKGTDLSGMFSSSGSYTGQLVLDTKAGNVQKYSEKLDAKWTAVEPFGEKKVAEQTTAMIMGAQRSISIEKID